MKAKKPLLLVAFAVILLLTLIIVPAVASAAPGGSGGGKPVNWASASFVYPPYGDLPVWTMDVIHVQRLQDKTVKGTYVDKSIGNAGEYSYRFRTSSFESEYWDTFRAAQGSLSHAYFGHAANYPPTLWPTFGWMGPPSNWADFVADADIADFVVYVPADQLSPALLPLLPPGADSMPVRTVLLDFGEPGKGIDRFMVWIFLFGVVWFPMNVPDEPVPVPNGNIQVHVGAPDF